MSEISLEQRVELLEAKVFPKRPEANAISEEGNWRWDGKEWRTLYVSWRGKYLKTQEDWDSAYNDPHFPFKREVTPSAIEGEREEG